MIRTRHTKRLWGKFCALHQYNLHTKYNIRLYLGSDYVKTVTYKLKRTVKNQTILRMILHSLLAHCTLIWRRLSILRVFRLLKTGNWIMDKRLLLVNRSCNTHLLLQWGRWEDNTCHAISRQLWGIWNLGTEPTWWRIWKIYPKCQIKLQSTLTVAEKWSSFSLIPHIWTINQVIVKFDMSQNSLWKRRVCGVVT
jgi:hypothetical protein